MAKSILDYPLEPAELLYRAETEILMDMVRFLRNGNIASAEWRQTCLSRMGALTQDANKIIDRYKEAILYGTLSKVDEAAMEQLLKSEAIYMKARAKGAPLLNPLPIDADPAISQTIAAWQATAKDQMNLAMATLLQNSGSLYVNTINRTTSQVITGAMSGREALVRTIREWAETGVPSIVDKANRQWTTEAYANMVIRTNVRRVTTEVQMQRAQEYDSDLIEVSSHAGARPLCAPYQGRVFSLSGKSEKYPPFSSTSYGEPAGLLGINCGHIVYPFFEGISRQTYAPDDTPEKRSENERIYQESQRQRALERSIRAAKRELAIYETLGDNDAIAQAKMLVRDRQATMREFIDDTGRTRQRAREQVYD